jgi:Protein of unknown function VcgC/VcgE (DUF2780)
VKFLCIAFFNKSQGVLSMKIFNTTATIALVITISGCAPATQNLAPVSGATGMSSTEAITSQLPSAGTAAGMMGSVAGSTPLAAQTPSLVGILVQQLGITPAQATGGAGSIFSVAKQSMSSTSFGQVSNAVPGMDQLIAAAPALGGSATTGGGSLLGSAASALGGSSLGNMVVLANSFQSLGMGSGMMNQFIPVILQYIQGTGGSSTMGLLQSVFMP